MNDRFTLHMPISAWEKAGDEYPLRIGGIVSTDKLDKQDEKVVQDGLDFKPFLASGWFNDNHGPKTTDVLGYPTGVKRVKPGESLPNGKICEHDGWWTDGYLLNTPEGRKLYGMAQSLENNPDRRLGFSIEGKVTKRNHDKAHPEVATAVVKNVAITHCPVNCDTEMVALAKALTGGGIGAGSSINAPASAAAGDGFALRREALEGSLADTSYGDDEDEDEAKTKAESQVPGFILKFEKAESDPPAEVSGFEYVEHWADSAAEFLRTPITESLSKSEAMIIVAHRLPHLSRSQIEAIVESSGDGA